MRYYGCKDKLLDFLAAGVAKTGINHGSSFCDLFSGTTTVAKHFKRKGYTVIANDMLELIAEGWFNGKKPEIYGKTGMCLYDDRKRRKLCKLLLRKMKISG